MGRLVDFFFRRDMWRWMRISVGIGFSTLIVAAGIWLVVRAYVVQDLQLTVAETLALVRTTPERNESWGYRTLRDHRYHWFKAANPMANPKLRDIFTNPKFPKQQMTAGAILGYTGSDEDAHLVINYLRKKCAILKDSPNARLQGADIDLVASACNSLGLMARRGVVPARRFIMDLAKGQEPLLIPIANPMDTTIEFALYLYAYMEPEDLAETVAARTGQASAAPQIGTNRHYYTGGIRYVEELESQRIWQSELRELRLRVANLPAEIKTP